MKTIEHNTCQKTIQSRFFLLITILSIFICFSCSKNDDNSDPPNDTHTEGTMQELRNFYNNGFVDAMIAIGFDVNLGNTPPDLESSFNMQPLILDETTVPSDAGQEGLDFGSYLVSFLNQNNSTLTINFEGQSSQNQTDNGNGCFITGSNGAFSVFAITTTTIGNATATTAIAFSGTVTTDGIEDMQFYIAMLDNGSNPDDIFIANNTGRLFVDGNGFSPEQ